MPELALLSELKYPSASIKNTSGMASRGVSVFKSNQRRTLVQLDLTSYSYKLEQLGKRCKLEQLHGKPVMLQPVQPSCTLEPELRGFPVC